MQNRLDNMHHSFTTTNVLVASQPSAQPINYVHVPQRSSSYFDKCTRNSTTIFTSRKHSSHLNNYTGISKGIFILYQSCSYYKNTSRTPTILLTFQHTSSYSNNHRNRPKKWTKTNLNKNGRIRYVCQFPKKKTKAKNTTKPPKNTNRTNYWASVFLLFIVVNFLFWFRGKNNINFLLLNAIDSLPFINDDHCTVGRM